jgi:alkanesulfonate monooxygenase SsuD/methylene tetrahydromethanopterin reductase-like flavin-dependent oxidoreductase (luciferase family)
LQRPLPLTIAAGGRRGLQLAARYGRNWVTIGPTGPVERTPEIVLDAVRRQVEQLTEACADADRNPASIGKVLLWMPYEPEITSSDQFDEIAAPYVELGFDQFVLHHPNQTGPFGGDVRAFEQIAARYGGG